METLVYILTVLIPLLVDDPLWESALTLIKPQKKEVLIPLLVDDPLWVTVFAIITYVAFRS